MRSGVWRHAGKGVALPSLGGIAYAAAPILSLRPCPLTSSPPHLHASSPPRLLALQVLLGEEFSIEILLKPGRLQCQARGVDKGGLLRQAIEAATPDFVLVLGDDHSDEPAFAALADWLSGSTGACVNASAGNGGGSSAGGGNGGGGGSCGSGVHSTIGATNAPNVVSAYGVTIGKKPTRATFFVDDQDAASGLLETLKWGSLRSAKSTSAEGLSALQDARSHSSEGLTTAQVSLNRSASVPPWANPTVVSMQPAPPMPSPPQSAAAAPPHSSDLSLPASSAEAPLRQKVIQEEGGCPYRQDQLSRPPSFRQSGTELTLTLPTKPMVALSALCATLLALLLRVKLGLRRRVLLALLGAALAVPKWRAALLRALEEVDGKRD